MDVFCAVIALLLCAVTAVMISIFCYFMILNERSKSIFSSIRNKASSETQFADVSDKEIEAFMDFAGIEPDKRSGKETVYWAKEMVRASYRERLLLKLSKEKKQLY